MKSKIIAIKHNKTSVLVSTILLFIKNADVIGTVAEFLIARLQKKDALAVLQNADTSHALAVYNLLNQKLREDKDIILFAINKTHNMANANTIIRPLRELLQNNRQLAESIADILITKYYIDTTDLRMRFLLIDILQKNLFFTEETANARIPSHR